MDGKTLVAALVNDLGPLELAHRPVRVSVQSLLALLPALGHGVEMELVDLLPVSLSEVIPLDFNGTPVTPLGGPPGGRLGVVGQTLASEQGLQSLEVQRGRGAGRRSDRPE